MIDNGFDASSEARVLYGAGLTGTREEADAWLRCGRHSATALTSALVLSKWEHAGVPPAQAVKWWGAGFDVHGGTVDAACGGWTPRQYRALLMLEFIDHLEGDERVSLCEAGDAWVASGIPADRALLCRRARYPLVVAHDFEERRLTDPSIDATVAVVAALRLDRPPRGWDARSGIPAERWGGLPPNP